MTDLKTARLKIPKNFKLDIITHILLCGNAFLHVQLCSIAKEHFERTYKLKHARSNNAHYYILRNFFNDNVIIIFNLK